MFRRTRTTLVAAAVVAALAPVLVTSAPASAVDQDLVVSAVNGPPGTEIEVTSATCVSDDDFFRVLEARLISGTAPDEVMAGAANGFDDDEIAILTVPDWIDPTEPAVIESKCYEYDLASEFSSGVETDFDPVVFDVEAGIDPPVQERTLSRTSLLAGQAFGVEGTGCFLPDATFFAIDVLGGDDLSGRDMGEGAGFGGGEVDDEDISGEAIMSNGGWFVGTSQGDEDDMPVIDLIEEYATDIPAGTYTALIYCGNDLGQLLMFQPELIEITGDAPFGDVDLTVAPESRDAVAAGGSCTTGTVGVDLEAFSSEEFGAPIDFQGTTEELAGPAARFGTSPAPDTDGDDHGSVIARTVPGKAFGPADARRALADDDFASFEATPDADGDWSVSDEAGFDNGIVGAYAVCGDPLEDGFFYDPQVAAVAVSPVQETTTTTSTPMSVPANAVQGSPSYAG